MITKDVPLTETRKEPGVRQVITAATAVEIPWVLLLLLLNRKKNVGAVSLSSGAANLTSEC